MFFKPLGHAGRVAALLACFGCTFRAGLLASTYIEVMEVQQLKESYDATLVGRVEVEKEGTCSVTLQMHVRVWLHNYDQLPPLLEASSPW